MNKETREMTKRVREFLNDSVVSQISNARLPGQPPDYNVPFQKISSVGLRTLSRSALAVDIENFFKEYKTVAELRMAFDCGEE